MPCRSWGRSTAGSRGRNRRIWRETHTQWHTHTRTCTRRSRGSLLSCRRAGEMEIHLRTTEVLNYIQPIRTEKLIFVIPVPQALIRGELGLEGWSSKLRPQRFKPRLHVCTTCLAKQSDPGRRGEEEERDGGGGRGPEGSGIGRRERGWVERKEGHAGETEQAVQPAGRPLGFNRWEESKLELRTVMLYTGFKARVGL